MRGWAGRTAASSVGPALGARAHGAAPHAGGRLASIAAGRWRSRRGRLLRVRVLALDTTTLPGSAAFWRDGRVALEDAPDDPRPFGERLPGWLLDVLARAGSTAAEVDLFVVGAGPGSLTGLRVGLATMQGMAFATGKALVAVSALEALAAAAAGMHPAGEAGEDYVAGWMNARRGEVFSALYGRRGAGPLEEVGAPRVGSAPEVASAWAAVVGRARLILCGDAAVEGREAWSPAERDAIVAVPGVPLAGVMAEIGARRAAVGEAGPPHAVQPLYVRRPDAEVARDRALAPPAAESRG